MMALFQLRSAESDDLVEVLRLIGSMADAPRWPDHAWLDLLAETSEVSLERELIVAMRADATGVKPLAGLAVVSCVADIAELETVVVEQSCRRLGAARQLCRAAMQWAARRGAAEIQLEVRASNVAARKLYGELGFAEVGTRVGYYNGPVEDAVLMNAELQADPQPREHRLPVKRGSQVRRL